MIDMTNRKVRYIMTPDGKGWMFGADGDTVTVQFPPEEGKKLGKNRCYQAEECDEITNS